MDKKQAAIEVLTQKKLIDPVVYLTHYYKQKTGLAPDEYYEIRYELAVRNNNHKQAKEALELYEIFHKE
ncbi:hypothetical protein P4646_19910 [Peribacillus simplex]|uniref:hypothetical protein n=1 Tax=Peribacillus simplex TaxID=1478 RepID=UPI002E1C2F5B|nr:hypothetical protein [Peribacillus simplex]MED4096829.1 hypothetical protein [Peribacillus simplex]